MTRPMALAAKVIAETRGEATIRAAAAGGFDAVGLWVEPEHWTAVTTREVRTALSASGLALLDIEVIRLEPGVPLSRHFRWLDIALELGASNALLISSDREKERVVDQLGNLCRYVASTGLRIALEFGLFTEIKTIAAAGAVMRAVGHPSMALLVDTLHLARSGGTAADVAALPREWLSYAQICDAPTSGPEPDDPAAIFEEAVGRRLPLGQGGLDAAGMITALPSALPLSVEVRSRILCEQYPDPLDRARLIGRMTRSFLNEAKPR